MVFYRQNCRYGVFEVQNPQLTRLTNASSKKFENFEAAVGHNCKAVHIAYARRALVTADSLEDCEDVAAKKKLQTETARP